MMITLSSFFNLGLQRTQLQYCSLKVDAFPIFFFHFQNDMGLKAHDCAKLMGQKECAEFLILYETSLEMASELSEVQSKREMLLVEHNELRTYFKYVNLLYSSISYCT